MLEFLNIIVNTLIGFGIMFFLIFLYMYLFKIRRKNNKFPSKYHLLVSMSVCLVTIACLIISKTHYLY